ncbi:uncharacterized protein [Battus philenor]|uniref:uncharacterized protein n=1 Tax=Battus philenor TaxID=42288 RepID=UPI0035CF342E
MMLKQLFVFFAVITLVCSIETDDIEHRKRGAGKTTGVNTIPTGIQKPEYTYTNIYSQSPNTQSSLSSQNYHTPLANSFYPSQASSQYYSPSSATDGTHSSSPQQQTNSQFVPLNFVPSPGYQTKYQIVSSKTGNGNIQLALLQSSPGFATSNIHVPQTLYSQQANQVNANTNPVLTSVSPHGHFNFPANYHSLSLASPYFGHAPTVLLPQYNSPFYNNLLYPTPNQNFFYQSQPKYNYSQSQSSTSNEHEKLQGSPSQSSSKDDNEIAAQNTEILHSDPISGYKNAYTSSRSSTYAKLK